jgi:hypothetical protein
MCENINESSCVKWWRLENRLFCFLLPWVIFSCRLSDLNNLCESSVFLSSCWRNVSQSCMSWSSSRMGSRAPFQMRLRYCWQVSPDDPHTNIVPDNLTIYRYPVVEQGSQPLLSVPAVFRIRDPGSGIQCFFTPRIRDLGSGSGMNFFRISDPGSIKVRVF